MFRRNHFLSGALLLGVMVWATPALAYPYVYVPDANAGTLSIIDASNNTILRTVPNLPNAYGVAVNHNGSRIYVTEGATGKVGVLGQAEIDNPNQNPVIGEFTQLGDPVAVAVGPMGKLLFVADSQSDQVTEINMPQFAIEHTYDAAGTGLSAIALDPAGRRVALASGTGSNSVVRVYAVDSDNYTDISLQSTPEALIFSSDGATLWITTGSGLVSYDLTGGNQSTTPVAGGAGAIDYSARQQAVYVASLSSDTVYVYPAAGGAPASITVNGLPTGVGLSPDGTRAYAMYAGGMDVIDTSTDQVVKTITFGQTGQAVAGHFIGPGEIWADNTVASAIVDYQISGTVTANDFLSRPLSYDVIEQPADGTFNFDQSTGAYTYTPPAGSSGVESFVWEATATSGAGSPTEPRSPPITATLVVRPTITLFSDQKVDPGSTVGPLSFTLQGSTPLDMTVTSSNTNVVDPANAQFSSGCGSDSSNLDCTLTLTVGNAQGRTATISVNATDPSGAVGTRTFTVTTTGSSGGGGGGSLSWLLLACLTALAGLVFRSRRRNEGI